MTSNIPYNTPSSGQSPVGIYEIRKRIWRGRLTSMAYKFASDIIQDKLIMEGFIGYHPDQELVGLGTHPERGDFLVYPVYSARNRLESFLMSMQWKKDSYLSRTNSPSHRAEAVMWGESEVPYTVISPNIYSAGVFISQNKDFLSVLFNILVPLTPSRFACKERLNVFTEAEKLIFIGDNPKLNGMYLQYCSKRNCRHLKDGATVWDLRAGNAFKSKCEFLERVLVKHPC